MSFPHVICRFAFDETNKSLPTMSHGPPPGPSPGPHDSIYTFRSPDASVQDKTDVMAFFDDPILGPLDIFPISVDGGIMGPFFDDILPNGAFPDPDGPRSHAGAATTVDSGPPSENSPQTASNNMTAAGSVPPGAQPPMSLAGPSTLTEFTKRRNWPAKVVEEVRDLLHIVDTNGRIRYASPSIFAIAGYTTDEVADVFLKDLIHPDDQGVFMSELNESIASGNPLRLFYRLRTKDGSYVILETIGHAHIAGAKFAPNPHNQSPFCQAVFMMARPYPTKNAGLLDSFLEHKMENERLRRRIAELRREEEAEVDEAQRQWTQSQEGRSEAAQSDAGASSSAPFFRSSSSDGWMSQPERTPLNANLTRENLEDSGAAKRPVSLRDKMARYAGASHTETIEMLTGLRYMEGERSRGITTGNTSPTLIKGDVGIAIPLDRDSRPGDKKKKLKTAEEYVCTDCGTLDSPEWRKGPSGPKTLCNACGLRWAKKEKKRNSAMQASQPTPLGDHAMGMG